MSLTNTTVLVNNIGATGVEFAPRVLPTKWLFNNTWLTNNIVGNTWGAESTWSAWPMWSYIAHISPTCQCESKTRTAWSAAARAKTESSRITPIRNSVLKSSGTRLRSTGYGYIYISFYIFFIHLYMYIHTLTHTHRYIYIYRYIQVCEAERHGAVSGRYICIYI